MSLTASADEGSFFVRGDYLLLRADLDNLTLTTKATVDVRADSKNQFGSSDQLPFNNDWKSAFRVALGYRPTPNCWEVEADWAHFDGTKRGEASGKIDDYSESPTVFFGTMVLPPLSIFDAFQPPSGFLTSHIVGTWGVQLDDISLSASRSFGWRCFSLKPSFGVRGLSLRQRLHYNFDSFEERNFKTEALANANTNFYGIGVTGGLVSRLDFGYGIGFYGYAEVAALYGRHRSASFLRTIADSVPPGDHRERESVLTGRVNALRSVIDGGFGIEWNSPCFNLLQVTLRLGWEAHNYFDQNTILVFRQNTDLTPDAIPPNGLYANGNLSLMGWVFSATVNF